TGPMSDIGDDQLVNSILHLRVQFPRAGVSMLDGLLRATGLRVSKARIRQALLQIDPVRRVFERITIRRREYQVAGPMALWHHDGQHDGAFIHNVRIERLWVDVTAQVGSKWKDFFLHLETGHGLNANEMNHISLLHYLFLPRVNQDLSFFTRAWNEHRIQMRNGRGPNRSPADMFGFDMIVHGIRGQTYHGQDNDLDNLSEEELEVYGVDWEALQEDNILASQSHNDPADTEFPVNTDQPISWIGRQGPPTTLNEVQVEPP
ncbi:hypothetical protein FA95DRAFT_1466219, partial [Auriscalpium vulgare]